jgi:hypothetical protein
MAVLGIAIGYYRNSRIEPSHSVVSRLPQRSEPIQSRDRGGTVDKSPAGGPAPQMTTRTASRQNAARERYYQERPEPREIATDFFPLVDFAPPVDDGELVRVSLPASAMREVGLPVREDRMTDRVQADVVVSHGLATAIRFVK